MSPSTVRRVDTELLAAIRGAGTLPGPPPDASETVRRWADAEGVRPGRWAAVTASGAAELVTRWAVARGWAPVTAREAAAGLRGLGLRRTVHAGGGARSGPRWRVAGRAVAERLADAARRALVDAGAERTRGGDGRG